MAARCFPVLIYLAKVLGSSPGLVAGYIFSHTFFGCSDGFVARRGELWGSHAGTFLPLDRSCLASSGSLSLRNLCGWLDLRKTGNRRGLFSARHPSFCALSPNLTKIPRGKAPYARTPSLNFRRRGEERVGVQRSGEKKGATLGLGLGMVSPSTLDRQKLVEGTCSPRLPKVFPSV